MMMARRYRELPDACPLSGESVNFIEHFSNWPFVFSALSSFKFAEMDLKEVRGFRI
jgi:hypothetical protein